MDTLTPETEFVVIDLPVRLTTADVDRLNLAIARAVRQGSPAALCPPLGDMLAALERARNVIGLRRRREIAFGADLFGDPGWDILLDLFVAEESHRPVSVTGVCHGSASPQTTVLRHLKTLELRGWVIRHASNADHRVIYVRLSDKAVNAMCKLLSSQ